MTQENVAEKINVSRQAISNWENEKSYPDIISVIELSNLYSISLDDLLKGDEKMIEHLEESTNVVKSNQKMIWAIIVNIIVVALWDWYSPEANHIFTASYRTFVLFIFATVSHLDEILYASSTPFSLLSFPCCLAMISLLIFNRS